MEDEAAVASLTQTLGNLNEAHNIEAVEAYIYQLERAYGVADTDLRPAYERLVRSTKDSEEASKALGIAMDVSAGTGQSLKTVTDALGRAYDGQTTTLSRLGVGLNKTQLETMSLDDIMKNLANTFAGQADASAQTLEGQLGRLQTAADNVKEAFGAGLLKALGDTNDTTQDLVDSMEDIEGTVEGVGKSLGLFATEAVKVYAAAAQDAGDNSEQAADQMEGMGIAAQTGGGLVGEIFASLSGPNSPVGVFLRLIGRVNNEMNKLGGGSGSSAGEAIPVFTDLNFVVAAQNRYYRDAAVRLNRLNNETSDATDETEDYARSVSRASSEVETYTKKQQKLLDQREPLRAAFQESRDDLLDQIQVVKDATAAVEDYANTIQQDLLSGINLGDLYGAQFDEEGNKTGTSLIEGFNAAINQAEWFGNVLNAIKAQGADQSLIEQIAGLGPETGGALGQQLLDEGLVPTMIEKWNGVQETTKTLALGLVPEFLEAGRQSAIENLNAMAEQFAKDQRRYKKLGKQLGRQVGAEFKKQIAKDVRDAVRSVEAAATAARAEAVAKAEAQQARLTEQSVALAVASVIRNSDQRAGRNVEPVLQ
ncbi:MAG TPA: hypothetical protein VIG24_09020 [Acidimicrobiia bacterium]